MMTLATAKLCAPQSSDNPKAKSYAWPFQRYAEKLSLVREKVHGTCSLNCVNAFEIKTSSRQNGTARQRPPASGPYPRSRAMIAPVGGCGMNVMYTITFAPLTVMLLEDGYAV